MRMVPSGRTAFGILLVICLIFPKGSALLGQEDFYAVPPPVRHQGWDWTLSLSPNYVYHPDAHPRIAGGINSMLFMGRYVSLNANVAGGPGYFQMGTGIIGIPIILLGGTDGFMEDMDLETFVVWLALMALVFENINFHIPLTGQLEISPYFSLLRLKYIKEGYGGAGSTWNMNLVGGIRLNIFLSDRFFLAPYSEVTGDWGHGNQGRLGLNGGIYTGFYFRRK